MLATIWTSASGTTGTIDENVPVKEYYQGATFRPTAVLETRLNEYCDTNLYVLLDSGGYVRGDDSSAILGEKTNSLNESDDEFIDSIVESDITVLLFPSSKFDEYVTPNWEEIVSRARPNTVWCIGTSKGSLKKLSTQKLENKGCKVLLYERSGVAPIGTEIRDQLLKEVHSRIN